MCCESDEQLRSSSPYLENTRFKATTATRSGDYTFHACVALGRKSCWPPQNPVVPKSSSWHNVSHCTCRVHQFALLGTRSRPEGLCLLHHIPLPKTDITSAVFRLFRTQHSETSSTRTWAKRAGTNPSNHWFVKQKISWSKLCQTAGHLLRLQLHLLNVPPRQQSRDNEWASVPNCFLLCVRRFWENYSTSRISWEPRWALIHGNVPEFIKTKTSLLPEGHKTSVLPESWAQRSSFWNEIAAEKRKLEINEDLSVLRSFLHRNPRFRLAHFSTLRASLNGFELWLH